MTDDTPADPGDGSDVEIVCRVVTCSLRLSHGGWCLKPDGHEGDHEGVPRTETPVDPSKLFLGARAKPK